MANSQQATVETSDNVAKLRKLILRQECKDRIGPLVTIILCRDVDNHAKLLTNLSDEVQQIKGSQSEHASHVSKRIHETEQDLMNLRQLIAEKAQSNNDINVKVHQLQDRMTEIMEQELIDWTGFRQDLKVVIEAMGKEQQAFNGVADTFELMGQQVTSLRHDINEIKNAIKKGPSDLLSSELIEKLEKKITSTLDRIPKETEAFKIPPEAIQTERGLDGDLAPGKPSDDDIGQSITNDRTPEHSPNSQEPQQRGPNIEDWPIILQFINIYEQFKEIYKSKKPENETQFIETFLNRITDEIDVHVSSVFQRHLLEIHPNRVALVAWDVEQQPPTIFIKMRRLRWNHIRRAIPMIEDLRVLQTASDQRLIGPPQNLTSKKRNRKRGAPTEEDAGRLGRCWTRSVYLNQLPKGLHMLKP
ncbi:hypothetical protein GGR58DRAFT_462585 [Xylaria digitata]|nr:hypothetical protein GGR58DRAFT_462585 [Xylaria digitata]